MTTIGTMKKSQPTTMMRTTRPQKSARRERLRRYNSTYYAAHRAPMNAKSKRWAAEHPERVRELARQRYARRRRTILGYQKAWRERRVREKSPTLCRAQ